LKEAGFFEILTGPRCRTRFFPPSVSIPFADFSSFFSWTASNRPPRATLRPTRPHAEPFCECPSPLIHLPPDLLSSTPGLGRPPPPIFVPRVQASSDRDSFDTDCDIPISVGDNSSFLIPLVFPPLTGVRSDVNPPSVPSTTGTLKVMELFQKSFFEAAFRFPSPLFIFLI